MSATPDDPATDRTGDLRLPDAPDARPEGAEVAEDGASPDGDAAAGQRPVRRALGVTVVAVATLVVLLDQVSKRWALDHLSRDGTPRPVIDGWLQLHLTFNPGAAFNMATGTTWIFTIIATAVAVLILRISRRLGSRGWALALGLLLGGAVGNLVDRLFRPPGFARGHVVDFIEYQKFPFMDFPIFNLADSAITCAAVLIGVLGVLGIALDGTRERRPEPRSAARPAADGPDA